MHGKNGRTIELDVRSQLKKKIEPFKLIMDTVKTLEKNDLFILHATFKPTPLLGLLRAKGLVSQVDKLAKDHWVVTFVHKKNKAMLKDISNMEPNGELEEEVMDLSLQSTTATTTLDNRGLEPPQPMMRTLTALERCYPGDEVHIHNDRVPVFLIEELQKLGYPYSIDQQADGSAKVKITKVSIS